MLSRRQFVCTAIAASVAPAIHVPPATPAPAPTALLPTWVVGTPGEFDWQLIRALTEDEAIIERARQDYGDTCYREDCSGCECCEPLGCGFDASRATSLDAIESPSPADWLRAGFDHTCSRCDREHSDFAVGDEALCEDCTTPAEWAAANSTT